MSPDENHKTFIKYGITEITTFNLNVLNFNTNVHVGT